jgi:hypothetical protein
LFFCIARSCALVSLLNSLGSIGGAIAFRFGFSSKVVCNRNKKERLADHAMSRASSHE